MLPVVVVKKTGHFARECRGKKNNNGGGGNGENCGGPNCKDE